MRILVFAPHADDEVLGCGGTMARNAAEGNEVYVCIVTSGMPPIFDNRIAIENSWPSILYPEAKASHKLLGVKEAFFLEFPAVMLETVPRHELNGKILDIVEKVRPDAVYMPHFGDMQKDHRIVAEAVMVAARPRGGHTVRHVYAYETLSETEWNIPHVANSFLPNVFVDISTFLTKKLDGMACYGSQLHGFPDPRSLEAVTALAKVRGSTMGAEAAEAFMLVREYDIERSA